MKTLLLIFMCSLIIGCVSTTDQDLVDEQASVITLTAEEAKARIDSDEKIIIVDVRRQDEFETGHIKDAILVPAEKIPEQAATLMPDKDAIYFLYCRSGNRSATAAKQLVAVGYKNIFDFGGIIYWTYEVEK